MTVYIPRSKRCTKCGQPIPAGRSHVWCKTCCTNYRTEWRQAHLERDKAAHNAGSVRYRARQKHAALQAYGGICSCCGEAEEMFLTIDHIDNDGAQHRRDSKITAGANTYLWLKRYDYPEGFQVLCANCNLGKLVNGGVCPHQKKAG